MTSIRTHLTCAAILIAMIGIFAAVMHHNQTVNADPVVSKITAEALHDVETGKLARPTLWSK